MLRHKTTPESSRCRAEPCTKLEGREKAKNRKSNRKQIFVKP
jgi:hypothetical protein